MIKRFEYTGETMRLDDLINLLKTIRDEYGNLEAEFEHRMLEIFLKFQKNHMVRLLRHCHLRIIWFIMTDYFFKTKIIVGNIMTKMEFM